MYYPSLLNGHLVVPQTKNSSSGKHSKVLHMVAYGSPPIHSHLVTAVTHQVHFAGFQLILYRRKFSPGENFRQFHHAPSLVGKIFYLQIFCPMLMVTQRMATYAALAKIFSTKYFCNIKVSGLGEIFCIAKIFTYTVGLSFLKNLY